MLVLLKAAVQICMFFIRKPNNLSFIFISTAIRNYSEKYDEVEDFIAKSVEKELGSPDAAVTPEPENAEASVSDKFERLNLFFDNQKVVTSNKYVHFIFLIYNHILHFA